MPSPVQQILFDADGVLQTWAPGSVAKVRDLPATSAPDLAASPYVTAHELRDAFLQAVFAAEKPCAIGAADFAQQIDLLRQQWKVRLPLDQVLKIWEAIVPIGPMFALIDRLRSLGIRCHLATNQQAYRARYMRHTLGYDRRFDSSFYSCDMSVAKPDPAYFQHIVQTLGVSPSELLFVDDRQDNVAAARSVGLQAVVFDAREVAAPEVVFMELVGHLIPDAG